MKGKVGTATGIMKSKNLAKSFYQKGREVVKRRKYLYPKNPAIKSSIPQAIVVVKPHSSS